MASIFKAFMDRFFPKQITQIVPPYPTLGPNGWTIDYHGRIPNDTDYFQVVSATDEDIPESRAILNVVEPFHGKIERVKIPMGWRWNIKPHIKLVQK